TERSLSRAPIGVEGTIGRWPLDDGFEVGLTTRQARHKDHQAPGCPLHLDRIIVQAQLGEQGRHGRAQLGDGSGEVRGGEVLAAEFEDERTRGGGGEGEGGGGGGGRGGEGKIFSPTLVCRAPLPELMV